MSLVQKLSESFSERIRIRGAQYHADRAVKIIDYSPTHVEAMVYGHGRYLVSISFINSKLKVACTCPYHGGGQPCKHLWATIIEVNKKNYLADASEHNRLELWFDDSRAEELRAEQESADEFQVNVKWQARNHHFLLQVLRQLLRRRPQPFIS